MNKSTSTLIRLISLLLLVVMSLSMVACDKLPFDLEDIFGNDQNDDNNKEDDKPACPHELVVDGYCFDCGEYLTITIATSVSNIAQPNAMQSFFMECFPYALICLLAP